MPLELNALGLRCATLRPGPSFAEVRPENEEPQTELLDPPSLVERRLRLRIGEMVATQAVEDNAGASMTRGQGRYQGFNVVLKRVTGGKGRAEMTLAELEAAVAWLERNRLSDHVELLDGDMRYAWSAGRGRGCRSACDSHHDRNRSSLHPACPVAGPSGAALTRLSAPPQVFAKWAHMEPTSRGAAGHRPAQRRQGVQLVRQRRVERASWRGLRALSGVGCSTSVIQPSPSPGVMWAVPSAANRATPSAASPSSKMANPRTPQ